MAKIQTCPLPEEALLGIYVRNGSYTDCYVTEIAGSFTHADFVAAFYTTWLFKLERFVLTWLVSKPSSDRDAQELAEGRRTSFAAWTVEARSNNQLLMCDFQSRTRSWLMSVPMEVNGRATTRLYFGSAVTRVRNRKTGADELSSGFNVLLGFHKLYSRMLLAASSSRLRASA